MGVDGILSGGFVFNPIEQSFTFQADSSSNLIFDTWYQNQVSLKDVYTASATVILTSIGREYVCTNGFLRTWQVIPSAARTLQPRRATIHWNSITAQNT